MKANSLSKLTEKEGIFLLNLVEKTLQYYFSYNGKTIPQNEIGMITNRLKKDQGSFVTLHQDGNLRGCIGHILPVQPLFLDVRANALTAAFGDPRFSPLTQEEWPDVRWEVSVLSVPQKLSLATEDNIADILIPNKHGVILKKGFKQATFLPQVWESLSTTEDFLNSLSLKAGLLVDAWQRQDIDFYIYTAQVFPYQLIDN